MNDIINYSAVSTLLTGQKGNIRRGTVPRKYAPDVQALEAFVDSWLDKIISSDGFERLNHGDAVEVGGRKAFITATYEGRDKCVCVRYVSPVVVDGRPVSEEILAGTKLLTLKKI